MVELQVVHNGHLGPVVQQLGALVEKCRVVLIGLDHKPAILGARAGRTAKILGHAANQKAGGQARMLQQPGGQRTGGGLAVGARHRQHATIAQQMLRHPLRARHHGEAAIEQGFNQGLAAACHIANHPEVGAERQLVHLEALHEIDASGTKLIAHRGVDMGIAARDPVAHGLCNLGQAAHEGSADADDVEVHGAL